MSNKGVVNQVASPEGRRPARLLHTPSLVAVGLEVGYETWPLIGWRRFYMIGWAKYWLGLPQSQSIVGSRDPVKFPLFFLGHWQSPWTALTAGICLPLGLCKETDK